MFRTHSTKFLMVLFTVLLVTQMVKNLPAVWETWVQSLGGKIPWRREWIPTPEFWPGEFHGQRSLEATVHGVTESDRTKRPSLTHMYQLFGYILPLLLKYSLKATLCLFHLCVQKFWLDSSQSWIWQVKPEQREEMEGKIKKKKKNPLR